jgi:predicted nucleic acid-binding protein
VRYIDTSVIVSALDPLDQEHDLARRVIRVRGDKVVSELTLVEMTSVIRRRQYGLDKKAIPDSPDIIDLYGKVLYILQEMNMRVLFPKESIIGSPFGNMTSPISRRFN